jgi:outer membrane usher protein FimD/PapC
MFKSCLNSSFVFVICLLSQISQKSFKFEKKFLRPKEKNIIELSIFESNEKE